MEANSKQRGFIKGKLAKSFSRVTKRSSHAEGGSKVMPSPSTQNGSVGFFADQKFTYPSSIQKVSYAKPNSLHDLNGYVNGTYGYGGDENVDMKAASYISYVRERFKLEKNDSDGRMYQEMV